MSQKPWRCRTCRHRFFVNADYVPPPPSEVIETAVARPAEMPQPAAAPPEAPAEKHKSRHKSKHKSHHHKSHKILPKSLKRWLIEAGLFAAMLLVFYLFLRYITTEHVPAGESAVWLEPYNLQS